MMKKRVNKMVALSLLGGFSLFSVTSCSTQVNFLNRGAFSDPPEIKSSEQGLISQFVSQVRPRPGNPDSHYLLAGYYQERGEHAKAIEEFQKVILIDPRHVGAHNGMGVSYDYLRDYAGAVECYKKSLALNPDLDFVLNNMGYSYLLQGKTDEAIPVLRKAIALNGREGKFHNNLGLAYAVKGQMDLALTEFQLAGDDSKAHFNIAQFYHRQGLYRIAQFHYSQALSLDPSFIHARMAMQAIDALAKIFQPSDRKKEEAVPESKSEENSPISDNQVAQAQSEPYRHEQSELRPVSPESEPVLLSAVEDARVAQVQDVSGVKSAELKPIPSPALRTEPAPPPSLPHGAEKLAPLSMKKAGIEISNGNGANGMARRVSRELEDKGLPVRRITNADHFNHRQTRIYYQNGYQELAAQVADQLPGLQKLEEQKKFARPNINVKVIIGKDIIPGPGLKGGGKS
jgi:Tfp pilus assembly protein PilF